LALRPLTGIARGCCLGAIHAIGGIRFALEGSVPGVTNDARVRATRARAAWKRACAVVRGGVRRGSESGGRWPV
jgi:hypothetical protein